MSLLEQIAGLFSAFETIPGLPDTDRRLLREKREQLPALLAGIDGVWRTMAEKDTLTAEDLQQLYDSLRAGGAGELAPFEALTRGLESAASKAAFSKAELYRWGEELELLSPRVPGTVAMDETALFLREKLQSFGIETWSEPLDFRGVFFHEWSLQLDTPARESMVCFPQNNVGFGDVEAPLIDVGFGRESDYEGQDVRGKIVLVNWGQIWDHEGPCAVRARYGLLRLYDIAVSQGVKAMVGYFEDTPGNALKLLEPGIKPVGGSNVPGAAESGPHRQFELPALNIGRWDALRLKELIKTQEIRAHLVIKGVRKVSTTQSVIGYLPGSSPATIACAAHSCTAFAGAVCDTVGVAGALALAKHFSVLPLSQRPKSMLFFFDSFHVWGNCCQTANLMLKNHPQLAERVEAFLWLDHFSDGQACSERLAVASEHPALWPLTALAMARRGIRPLVLPLTRIWSLCACGPFERRGIPNITMQAFGDQVLTTEDTWDKFDADVLWRDVQVQLDIAGALMELEALPNAPGEPVGGCGALFTETETPVYPPGEHYAPEPSYPLYIGGEKEAVRILRRGEDERLLIG